MKVYADHAATTPMRERAKAAMIECLEEYGNPSSIHAAGRMASMKLESARKEVAELLNCRPAEIYFTSGSTEADNWAIRAARYGAGRVVTSAFEHPAVLHTLEAMEREGTRKITRINPEPDGILDPEKVAAEADGTTNLVSVMAANNEIGTIEPLREIGAIAQKHGVLFHTDAVQAFGHIPLDVDDLKIDMLSASGHKLNGPKGVGMLYIRKGVKIRSFLHGGAQERRRRAGTLNVPGIVGFGTAARLAHETMKDRRRRECELRDHLIARVLNEIPYTRLNGPAQERLPNNANFCFRFIEGESLLIRLDQAGICGSSGSACTSGSLDPSHVLLAIGLPHEIAHGSLRLTLSEANTPGEIDYTVDELKKIVSGLREMSPLYEDFIREQK